MNQLQIVSPFAYDSGNITVGVFSTNCEFTGLQIVGEQVLKTWLKVACPCGVTDTFAYNKLPEVDTPQSCGNPKHWVVRFQEDVLTEAVTGVMRVPV